MDMEPLRLVLSRHGLAQLIPHQLVSPARLKPSRYLLNNTPLLHTSTSTSHTAHIALLLKREYLNGNPQAILAAGPSKPRPIRMRLLLRIVQPRQHPHHSFNGPIIDLKLREKQGKSIERVKNAQNSYIGKEGTQNETREHEQEDDLLDLLTHQHRDAEQDQHHRAYLHYLIRKLIPSLEMIALAVVTIVTPIFIGGQVHLILHLLDRYMRGELDVMLVLEASAVVIGPEDYLPTAALGVGLLTVHDLLDASHRGELVLVWGLFLGGFGRRRVLGGFYAFGESTNSHAHFCRLLLEYRKCMEVWGKMEVFVGVGVGQYERIGAIALNAG